MTTAREVSPPAITVAVSYGPFRGSANAELSVDGMLVSRWQRLHNGVVLVARHTVQGVHWVHPPAGVPEEVSAAFEKFYRDHTPAATTHPRVLRWRVYLRAGFRGAAAAVDSMIWACCGETAENAEVLLTLALDRTGYGRLLLPRSAFKVVAFLEGGTVRTTTWHASAEEALAS